MFDKHVYHVFRVLLNRYAIMVYVFKFKIGLCGFYFSSSVWIFWDGIVQRTFITFVNSFNLNWMFVLHLLHTLFVLIGPSFWCVNNDLNVIADLRTRSPCRHNDIASLINGVSSLPEVKCFRQQPVLDDDKLYRGTNCESSFRFNYGIIHHNLENCSRIITQRTINVAGFHH